MTQAVALAAAQDAIATQYPDLSIELIAQVHYIRPDEIAHIDVYGCDDAVTRRAIRANAVRLLQQLGVHVELIGAHDVYTVSPDYSDPATLQGYASRLYVMMCAETGAYVDPAKLPARLRARVDAQALRQRPIVDGRAHYYVADVIAELEAPASALPPFWIPSDGEVEAELAQAMPLLLRMEAAIQDSDKDDD